MLYGLDSDNVVKHQTKKKEIGMPSNQAAAGAMKLGKGDKRGHRKVTNLA
jgi:hypothetical protein